MRLIDTGPAQVMAGLRQSIRQGRSLYGACEVRAAQSSLLPQLNALRFVTVSDEHFFDQHIQILRHEIDIGFEQIEQAARARRSSIS
jgi:hypothetical protein